MKNILEEKYFELENLDPQDSFYYKNCCLKVFDIVECATTIDSGFIRDILVKNFKVNFNEYFPAWLTFLLFKVYVLKKPKDTEIFELAMKFFELYSTHSSDEIKSMLLPEDN